jgi:Golgi apparatus protein 1
LAKYECNTTAYVGPQNGTIIGCLRDMKDKLKPACKKEIYRFQADAAFDYRADPMLYHYCQEDVPKNCPDVIPGGGRVQACLVRKVVVGEALLPTSL